MSRGSAHNRTWRDLNWLPGWAILAAATMLCFLALWHEGRSLSDLVCLYVPLWVLVMLGAYRKGVRLAKTRRAKLLLSTSFGLFGAGLIAALAGEAFGPGLSAVPTSSAGLLWSFATAIAFSAALVASPLLWAAMLAVQPLPSERRRRVLAWAVLALVGALTLALAVSVIHDWCYLRKVFLDIQHVAGHG